MDVAFAPGPTAFDLGIKKMFKQRANTTVIDDPFITTIAEFVKKINTRTPQSVATNIVIGTHGDDNAFMQIQLNTAYGANTYFESLLLEMAATPRTCQLADALINPRPKVNNVDVPALLVIKGCRIGQSLPFLNKIKAAINGLSTTTINVVAPKYFEAIHTAPQGTVEMFLYDFHHFSKTKIADKKALVAVFVGLAFKDINGVAIPKAKLEKWIPKNIHQIVKNIETVNFNPFPIPNIATGTFGRYKYSKQQVFDITVHISSGTLPTTLADRITALKAEVASLAATPGTNPIALSLSSTHEYPYYTRFGYTDMDNLIDNLEWTFTVQGPQDLYCVGVRHEYNINNPVVGPTNNELIYNFFAEPGQGTTSIVNYTDTDTRFYVQTP